MIYKANPLKLGEEAVFSNVQKPIQLRKIKKGRNMF